MKTILLLLSTNRASPQSIATAFDIVESEKAELLLLYVMDDVIAQGILDKMTEEAWIGGKASEDLQNSILREYFSEGKDHLKEIEKEAGNRGIPCRSIYARGDITPVALGVIAVEQVDIAVVTRRKRSHWSRFFFGSPIDELRQNAECEVVVVDVN